MIIADLSKQLDKYVQDGPDALIFTSPEGTPLRHGNFTRRAWNPAIEAAGLPGVHFHDLRHAGNTWVANAGANLRELMERMGQSTARAAMIYQHSTSQRQRTVADAVDKAARAELRRVRQKRGKAGRTAKDEQSASGTKVAREPNQGQ